MRTELVRNRTLRRMLICVKIKHATVNVFRIRSGTQRCFRSDCLLPELLAALGPHTKASLAHVFVYRLVYNITIYLVKKEFDVNIFIYSDLKVLLIILEITILGDTARC